MTVYVDLVFFNNLAVDGTVLLATAKVRHLRPTRTRLFSGAILGALYAAVMFWAHIPYLYSFGVKVMISLFMVLLTFGYGGPLQLARNFCAFYLVNFATLGGVIGLSFLLQSADSPWGGMSFTPDGGLILKWQMQLGMFIVTFLLSVWLFRSSSETRKKRQELEQLFWEIEIKLADGSWKMRALLDTGNRLYDPLTRIPVMIMEASIWREELPAGWCDRLKEVAPDQLLSEMANQSMEQYPWADRLRLVPYRGVNGNTRLMLAVKPDAVLLSKEGHPPLQVNRVLIGLDGGTLSSEGTYRAIVHPDMALADAASSAPSQPA
ncbi:stage II sporulation protein GA (sporulation sigma-E factor processing peptidase) [Cohnella lupini]|uniref:Stage II sporulation protein GA (Sporulation sigma-E factor processing peptidase) n=2 Tax=Cohnella lupini TaxID=1294267 RepID=A0A3D9IXF0_9BACL|nr:stage II sporulation protein GA (sporulation sigma-E factor processing peptidase) [Cohnella lupini]